MPTSQGRGKVGNKYNCATAVQGGEAKPSIAGCSSATGYHPVAGMVHGLGIVDAEGAGGAKAFDYYLLFLRACGCRVDGDTQKEDARAVGIMDFDVALLRGETGFMLAHSETRG